MNDIFLFKDLQPSPLEVQIIQPPPVLQEPLITATSFRQEESKDTLCSDSNLHSIARKLSRTLKESAPCEECSKLPAELTEAAKCIKDLTDMVESRKINKYRMDLVKDSYSQSPPTTQETFCQCSDLRDIAAGASKTITTVEKSDNPKSKWYMVVNNISPKFNILNSLKKLGIEIIFWDIAQFHLEDGSNSNFLRKCLLVP